MGRLRHWVKTTGEVTGRFWMRIWISPTLSSLHCQKPGLPPPLTPLPFYSLAGAVNEFPGPKEGLAFWWSQGTFGSQNCHEVLRKDRIPVCGPQKEEAGAKAPLGHRPSRHPPTPWGPRPTTGDCGFAPWPPAPAVPGSAARSPAAPEQCRRVSAPNGHAALAPGTGHRGPGSPCRT